MRFKLTLKSEQLSEEDIRRLIQTIRDCEQNNFPDKNIQITIDVPDMTSEETKELLTGLKTPLKYGPYVSSYKGS